MPDLTIPPRHETPGARLAGAGLLSLPRVPFPAPPASAAAVRLSRGGGSDWARTLALCLPLTHVARVMRELSLGRPPAFLLWDLAYLFIATVPVALLGVRLMRKRLVI